MEQSVEKQLELIRRNTVELIPEDELRKKIERSIATKTPLRVKIGLDPNRPDLHIGHTIGLQKLRDFQDLGHKAVLIVGDFTGFIGDPSGRDSERAAIDWETVESNAQTYFKQASKIIDYRSAEVRYNSEWLAKMSFRDVLELARAFTVHRMLERDDFEKRYKEGTPISIMEFLYPLAQAYDSVAIKADIELGGTDQRFNLMVGRVIQERYNQEAQCLVIMPLLEGTDGVRKMSKSLDNFVGITDIPHDMYGKVMRIHDELIGKWRELVTLWPHSERVKLEAGLRDGSVHPMTAKKLLAYDVVAKFHSKDDAVSAQDHFTRVFSDRELPPEDLIPEFHITKDLIDETSGAVRLVDLILASEIAKSKGEARRLIRAGSVYWKPEGEEERKIDDELASLKRPVHGILRAGKRRVFQVKDE
jgi:tyrosyl-tRNA synthetase